MLTLRVSDDLHNSLICAQPGEIGLLLGKVVKEVNLMQQGRLSCALLPHPHLFPFDPFSSLNCLCLFCRAAAFVPAADKFCLVITVSLSW